MHVPSGTPLTKGVPLGSIINPTLFSIYVKGVGEKLMTLFIFMQNTAVLGHLHLTLNLIKTD